MRDGTAALLFMVMLSFSEIAYTPFVQNETLLKATMGPDL